MILIQIQGWRLHQSPVFIHGDYRILLLLYRHYSKCNYYAIFNLLLSIQGMVKFIPYAGWILIMLVSTTLHGGDPINPNEPGGQGSEFSEAFIGSEIRWINSYAAQQKGYQLYDEVKIIGFDPETPKLATIENGSIIHVDWRFINYEIFARQSFYQVQTLPVFIAYRIPTERIPSDGTKPEFYFGVKCNATATWDGRNLDQQDYTTGGFINFDITDPTVVKHTIPDYAFKVGFDTYRLSSFNQFITYAGTQHTLDPDIFIPGLQVTNFQNAGNIFPQNGAWMFQGYNTHFTDPTLIRNILIRISVVFTRQKWDGTKSEFYIHETYPLALQTTFDD